MSEGSFLSRRQLLKIGALLGGTTALDLLLAACGMKPADIPSQRSRELKPHEPGEGELPISLGLEEVVTIEGLPQYSPDGHLSTLKDASGRLNMWVSADVDTYLARGSSFNNLRTVGKVLSPDRQITSEGFQRYRAFGSVLRGRTLTETIGFYHEELSDSEKRPFPFKAYVGLATSTDGGFKWALKGRVIAGMDYGDFSKGRPYGAGQPSAIRIGDEVYVFYTDWNERGADAIHLAKAPLASVDNPASWLKFSSGEFKNPGIGGESSPVIADVSGQAVRFASLPGVSFNMHLNRYLATYVTDDGFYVAQSMNGINWERPQALAKFPVPHSQLQPKDIKFNYLTFLSDTASHTVTSNTGWLYYSAEIHGMSPHIPVRRSVTIGNVT